MKVALDHPANARILAHLRRTWDRQHPGNESAPPSVYDLHRNSLGTHPDLAEQLWTTLTVLLPEPCGWVVYGRPVLVRPSTGVLFGYAGGTHCYALRLPDAERAEALAAGAARIFHYSIGPSLSADELGDEWVFCNWRSDETRWCLAAYHLAGL